MTEPKFKIDATGIRALIVDCLRNLNDELEEEDRFELTDNMTLLGSSSAFDSMSLVMLIMDAEGAILDRTDIDISLVTEEAMSRSKSPFRTVETLAEYIGELLDSSDV